MAVAITATAQTGVYPPRVAVSVTGLTVGVSFVSVRRRWGDSEVVLRSGVSDGAVTDTSFVVIDAEVPFGVPVTYAAIVNFVSEYTTTPATYTLTGGKVALSDAITGLSVETVILSWEAKTLTRQASLFRVGYRNVVVTGELGQYEADVELFTDTDVAQIQMYELLETATESIVQLRSADSDTYADVDSYFCVTSVDVRRWSQDGSDPRRVWTLHVAETDEWASQLEAQTFTYADVAAFYSPSGTYANLAADHATYLDVLTADWS